jgi:hypothetical protein
MRKMRNKKAQIGETMTWVIATIIIIVILIFSIFITSILGVTGSHKEYKSIGTKPDLIPVKSLTSYLLTKDNSGQKVFDQLKNEENLNEFNGNLALKIFNYFYLLNYAQVWMGINKDFSLDLENDYFGSRNTLYGGSSTLYVDFTEFINLGEDKSIQLILRAY